MKASSISAATRRVLALAVGLIVAICAWGLFVSPAHADDTTNDYVPGAMAVQAAMNPQVVDGYTVTLENFYDPTEDVSDWGVVTAQKDGTTEVFTFTPTAALTGEIKTAQWVYSYGDGAVTETKTGFEVAIDLESGGKTLDKEITLMLGKEAYTVSFNGNGGTGAMRDLVVEKGKSAELPLCAFTPAKDYEFGCWGIDSNGAGDKYNPGDMLTPTANTIVYALWYTTQAPEMSTSAGSQFISKTTEVTYTITQLVPEDATYMRISFDLVDVMNYTTKDSEVTVEVDGTAVDGATVAINDQLLTVTVDDEAAATALRGKKVVVTFKAKIKSDADLTPYLNSAKTTASIPYKAVSEFKGFNDITGKKTRSVESKTEYIKVTVSSTKATTAKTGDAIPLVAVLALVCASAAVLVACRARKLSK